MRTVPQILGVTPVTASNGGENLQSSHPVPREYEHFLLAGFFSNSAQHKQVFIVELFLKWQKWPFLAEVVAKWVCMCQLAENSHHPVPAVSFFSPDMAYVVSRVPETNYQSVSITFALALKDIAFG